MLARLRARTVLGSATAQVSQTCATLAADPTLAGGFHLVAFDQAGVFARFAVQSCREMIVVVRATTLRSRSV